MSELLFRFRVPLSAANSVILALLLLLWFDALVPVPQRRLASLSPIELTLVEPEAPQSHEPLLAQPWPKAERMAARIVAQAPAPAMAQAETGNAPVAPPSLQTVQAAQPAQAVPFVQPAPAAVATLSDSALPAASSGREAEAQYVGKVRAYLQSIKRYPTGREASLQRPAGTAVIWFIVRRSGELAEAGIVSSSGAMLLDNTALATVRRGSYPPFPDEAWAGRAQQRFTVELDFVPNN